MPPGPSSPSAPRWRGPHSDRERALLTRGTFLLHLRPARVSRRSIRWTHTFGLGGSALVLWLALAFTGMLMLLVYQPVPDVAHRSVRTLTDQVQAGALVRGVHYWGANLLVVVAVLHLLRVVLTGGYHRPRRLNWVLGVALLGVVLGSVFTGYLLPWDQRAFWAVTISAGMLAYIPAVGPSLQAIVIGGADIGADTLLAFYTYHTTFLPVFAIVLMAFHFWRVRRAKGVVEPPANDPADADQPAEKVMFLPDLLVREAAQALVVVAIIVVLAALLGAPIGEPANPGMSPNPAKAAWYFMGFQELLIHLHPVYAVFVLPFAGLAALVALPWLGDDRGPTGRWFLTPAGTRAAVFAATAAIALTVLTVIADDSLLTASTSGPGPLTRGLLPTAALIGIAVAIGLVARRRWKLGRNEVVQTIAVFALAMFATLTAIGVFFRGEGMALCAPWQV